MPEDADELVLPITRFGGKGDGRTDNLVPFNRAFAALAGTSGGVIAFPPGKYLFSASPVLKLPPAPFGLGLKGAGIEATILYFPGSDGLNFTAAHPGNSFDISGFTITTQAAGRFTGLTITQAQPLGTYLINRFDRLVFRGDDKPGGGFWWNTGMSIQGLSGCNYTSVMVWGGAGPAPGSTGVSLTGNTGLGWPAGASVAHSFAGCNFYLLGTGIAYGTFVQGVTLTQCNFVDGSTGVLVVSGDVGANQLAVVASQFNTQGDQIRIAGVLLYLDMTGNLLTMLYNNATGIRFVAGAQAAVVSISGNTFTGDNTTQPTVRGIVCEANSVASMVVGSNSFFDLATGIDLLGATGSVVLGNTYLSVTSQVINPGSNQVGVATP